MKCQSEILNNLNEGKKMKKMKSLSICLLLFSGIVNAEVKQLEIIMDFSQYPYYIPENYSYEFNYTYTSIDGNPFFDYEKNGVKLPITGLTCDALKMCIGYVSVDFNNQSAIYASVNGVGDSNIRSSNSDELMVINAKLYFSFDYSPVITDPNGTYVVSFEDGIALAESMQPIYEGNYYSGGVVTTPSAAGSLVSNPAVKGSGSYNVVLDSSGKILEVVFVANSAPTIALTATSSSYVQGSPVTINAVVSDRENDAVIGCNWSLNGVLTGGTSCTQFISSTLLLGDNNIRLAVKYKNVSDQEVEIFSDVAVNIFKAPQMSVPSSVVFTCTKGDGLLTGISLTPTNIGGGTYNWSLNTPSATWLKASPNSGIVGVPFTLTANCTGLLAGTYIGNVTVQSTDSTNSAVNVVATLTVKEVEASNRSLDLESSSSQRVYIPDANQVGLDLSTALTFEVLTKFETLPTPGHVMVLHSKDDRIAGGGNAQRSVVWYIYNNAGTYVSQIFVDKNGNVDPGSYDFLGTNIALSVGSWTHLAVSWSGASKIARFYVNGIQIGSQTGVNVSTLHNSTGPYTFGSYSDGMESFDGKVDEIRVWNIVRTQTEINNNKGKKLIGNEAGLVEYQSFDSGNLLDKSQKGNNLIQSSPVEFSTDAPLLQ